MTRFEPKVGQISPKWDKSGTYSDQISVHFGSPSQNVLKSDLNKSRIRPIWRPIRHSLLNHGFTYLMVVLFTLLYFFLLIGWQ